MKSKFLVNIELILWAFWLGALWFLALLVAPALFKWLARPEAGLVAGRLFYLMSWASLGFSMVLIAFAALRRQVALYSLPTWCLLLVCVVSVLELAWLSPAMHSLRQAISAAVTLADADQLRSTFGQLHGAFSLLYAFKMIAVVVWGVLTYGRRLA